MSKGIIIKIGDNKNLLSTCLDFLLGFHLGEPQKRQSRKLFILKEFEKTPDVSKKWSCLKSSSKGVWEFSAVQNYGEQVGEQYISSTHWVFLEGEDIELLYKLS